MSGFDEDGVEAAAGTVNVGLGLLPVQTHFAAAKATRRVTGRVAASHGAWAVGQGEPIEGYEIHMGRTQPVAGARHVLAPLLTLVEGQDGAISADGAIAGTYVHGLFHNDGFRRALLAALGRLVSAPAFDAMAEREHAFDRLADVVRTHLKLPRIRALLWPEGCA